MGVNPIIFEFRLKLLKKDRRDYISHSYLNKKTIRADLLIAEIAEKQVLNRSLYNAATTF